MLSEWDIVLRVAVAAVLGGLVGFDREARDKPAGVRTHALVAVGAALFVGVSVLVSIDLESGGSQSARIDSSRVTAGVMTGVGFLGAGSIIRRDGSVSGLTTAAGITPLMLERSVQAQFLIPMATSLSFGVLFGTFVILLIVPATYLIFDDIGRILRWTPGKKKEEEQPAAEPVATAD